MWSCNKRTNFTHVASKKCTNSVCVFIKDKITEFNIEKNGIQWNRFVLKERTKSHGRIGLKFLS